MNNNNNNAQAQDLNYEKFEELYLKYANDLMKVNLGDELCDIYSSVLSELEMQYPIFYKKLEKRLEKIF